MSQYLGFHVRKEKHPPLLLSEHTQAGKAAAIQYANDKMLMCENQLYSRTVISESSAYERDLKKQIM